LAESEFRPATPEIFLGQVAHISAVTSDKEVPAKFSAGGGFLFAEITAPKRRAARLSFGSQLIHIKVLRLVVPYWWGVTEFPFQQHTSPALVP
jgi:hypothetical protein